MLNLTLQEQIQTFVGKLWLVEERQVYKFFNEWGKHNIEFELDSLRRRSIIHDHPNGRLSVARLLPTSQRNYDEIIRAIDVMCFFPSQNINAFNLDAYPVELNFLTSDNIIYDVTVFTWQNWVHKYAMIPKARKYSLPDGEKDPVNHVAVVESEDMVRKVAPLGFSVFAIVDRNGSVKLYTL